MPFGSDRGEVLVPAGAALPGREHPAFRIPEHHAVLGTPLQGPPPDGSEEIFLAMGCFWGAERLYWQLDGVTSTAVGYQGGFTPHPTYEEVCTGRTGHAETVRVVHDPRRITAEELLRVFWEAHDPTQGFRQGNDVGSQYRSAVYWTTPEQQQAYLRTRQAFQHVLREHRLGEITTEGRAEGYHQQYLHRVPGGYCPDHGIGISCPVR
jgi:peptide-methionine (S)-S-oxide reductase